MRTLLFSLRLARQYYHQHKPSFEHRIIGIAQCITMSALLCLTLVSANIQHFLQQNMQQLLGADMVVSSNSPFKRSERDYLIAQSQAWSQQQLMTVTLSSGEQWQRARLKVVDNSYPLKGQVTRRTGLSNPVERVNNGPEKGEVWIDSRLMVSLGKKVGQTLKLGHTSLLIGAVLEHEPDRLLEGHNVDMRAMLHRDSLPEEFALSPGQVFRVQMLMETPELLNLKQDIKQSYPRWQVLDRFADHPLSAFWKRSENFVGLSFVVVVFLAALAIHQASAGHIQKVSYFSAVCLSQGAKRSSVTFTSVFIWLVGVLRWLPLALILAFTGQIVFVSIMQQHMPGLEWSVDVAAVVASLCLVLILLITFQLPAWYGLRKVSVAGQLVRHVASPAMGPGWVVMLPAVTIVTLVYTDNPLLTSMVFAIVLLTATVMWLSTLGALKLGLFATRKRPGVLSFSLYMVKKRLGTKVSQIMALGLGLTLLLMTLMLMADLQQQVAKHARVNDGNLLISQATRDHIEPLREWQEQTHSQTRQWQAYLPARVLTVNGQAVEEFVTHPSDSSARLSRPVRVQLSSGLPDNNILIEGEFWHEPSQLRQQVSVESEVMTDLGLVLGDKLGLVFADHELELEIVASHEPKSGQGVITFWFQMPAALAKNVPVEPLYMGSLEVSEQGWSRLYQLWPQVPGLRWISLQELTENAQRMLGLVSGMILAFSVLLLLMALLVTAAAVQRNISSDSKRNGLLLSMGKSRRHLMKLAFYQSLFSSLVAAGGAILGTWLCGQLIYRSQFSMNYQADPIWLMGCLSLTILIMMGLDWSMQKHSLNTSIRHLLQEERK